MKNLQKLIVCDLPFLLWSIEILESDPQNTPFFVVFYIKLPYNQALLEHSITFTKALLINNL